MATDSKFSSANYLYWHAAKQDESAPFIGDLYNADSENFHKFDKKLFVKSLNVSSTTFKGEIILGNVDWNEAPDDYDHIIVGVEVIIPSKGRQSLNGTWSLGDMHGHVNTFCDIDITMSPGNVKITKYHLHPLQKYKNSPYAGKPPHMSNSFFLDLRNLVSAKVDKARAAASDIISYHDATCIDEVSKSSKTLAHDLNGHLLAKVKHLTSDNWVSVTYSMVKQYNKIIQFIKEQTMVIDNFDIKYHGKRALINKFKFKKIEYVCSVDQWSRIMKSSTDVRCLLFVYDLLEGNENMAFFMNTCNAMRNSGPIKFCAVDLEKVSHTILKSPPRIVVVRRYVRGVCVSFDSLRQLSSLK